MKRVPTALIVLGIIFFSLAFLYLLFLTYYRESFFPGVTISGQNLRGYAPQGAYQEITANFQSKVSTPIKLNLEGETFTLDLSQAAPYTDLSNKITQAYVFGRSGSYLLDFKNQILALSGPVNFTPQLNYQKRENLTTQLDLLNQKLKITAVDAHIILGESITITPSKTGQELDRELILGQIENYLTSNTSLPQTPPIKVTLPGFQESRAEKYKQALNLLQDSPLVLYFENQSWTIDQATLYTLLNIPPSSNQNSNNLFLNPSETESYLKSIAEKINRPSFNAKFVFNPQTKKVSEFQAAQTGQELDISQTISLLEETLTKGGSLKIELPVKIINPDILTGDVNTFGIQGLLGQGVSRFAGSIENRIYNIQLAASRINGTLIPPGGVFSFNQTVGEISAATGYKQAYVIKSGRTVLDDGGGVCQVSTTLFRAVLNSGLPVVERTAHAYRVGYYEQGFPPGLDATVFSPSVDFKFRNNTSSYILIQAYTSGATLFVDFYGSDDGRITTLSTPQITNQTPPPAELRQDDPGLPKGVVKQVDWPAWGASVSFKRTVKRGGETLISETWRSNYKPWQAVYLVGTKE